MKLDMLILEWRLAKQQERDAIERRRAIEDKIRVFAEINDASEQTLLFPSPNGTLRVRTKLDRKVDAARVKDAARRYGLNKELDHYFRWKAELNLQTWRQAPPDVVMAFAPAITTKPTRPSFELSE